MNQPNQWAYTSPYPCAVCGSHRLHNRKKITTGGWVTFVILLLLFFPLCWIGLLMRSSHIHCLDCGSPR